MIEDFNLWNSRKQEINTIQKKKYIYMRQIWWVSLGLNIGKEINGKNHYFERPVLVLKVFNHETTLIVPLTTQQNSSEYHMSVLYPNNFTANVNLSQIRVISTKRFIRKITKLDIKEFYRVTSLFERLFNWNKNQVNESAAPIGAASESSESEVSNSEDKVFTV